MSAHIPSYYAKTLQGAQDYPVLDGDHRADVCVIGGGLAGLACALGLLERGKSVILLESRKIGFGASGRNGGFCLSGFSAGAADIERKIGLENTRTLLSLTRDAQKLIRRRIADFSIPADPVDGHLKCAWFDEADSMKRSAETLSARYGENVAFMPRTEVRDICKTAQYYDALFFPDYFHMHPLNYAAGIAAAITRKGGRIFEDSAAVVVHTATNGHVIRTSNGRVEADHVVYCGSAYANDVDKKARRACLPISTYVMVTQALPPEKMAAAITKPYAVRDTRWADDYYRVLPDGRLLWGGRIGLGETAPANLRSEMLADLLKIYPQLAGIKAEVAWAGIMGYTTHKMPHIGHLGQGRWICTHFGGNGVGPTTAGGELIARAIAEGDETYRLFEPFRLRTTGGPFGPLVAQGVYFSWEIRDRLKSFRRH